MFLASAQCSSIELPAQVTGATLSGAVTDRDNKLIPNVTITLTSVAQGPVRTTETNESGSYTLPILIPGTYNLEIVAQGFLSQVQNSLTLAVEQNQTINVALQVGQVVYVSDAKALLDLRASNLSAVVSGEPVRAM